MMGILIVSSQLVTTIERRALYSVCICEEEGERGGGRETEREGGREGGRKRERGGGREGWGERDDNTHPTFYHQGAN